MVMMRTFLVLSLVMGCIEGSSIPIHKQVVGPEGETIDIDIQVDIDTGDEGGITIPPAGPDPTEPTEPEPLPDTPSPPEVKCLSKGAPCNWGSKGAEECCEGHHCYQGPTCLAPWCKPPPAYCRVNDDVEPPSSECLQEGDDCAPLDECCEGFFCENQNSGPTKKFIGKCVKGVPPSPKCLSKGDICKPWKEGVEGMEEEQCCEGHYCRRDYRNYRTSRCAVEPTLTPADECLPEGAICNKGGGKECCEGHICPIILCEANGCRVPPTRCEVKPTPDSQEPTEPEPLPDTPSPPEVKCKSKGAPCNRGAVECCKGHHCYQPTCNAGPLFSRGCRPGPAYCRANDDVEPPSSECKLEGDDCDPTGRLKAEQCCEGHHCQTEPTCKAYDCEEISTCAVNEPTPSPAECLPEYATGCIPSPIGALLKNGKECCEGYSCTTNRGMGWCVKDPKSSSRLPKCLAVGEACTPGNPEEKCCSNSLCDLDNKICVRVAYRKTL